MLAKLFIFYFRSMNKEKKSVGEIVLLFHRELKSRYPDTEIKAIIYCLFDSLMGWSRATVQLNKAKLLDEQNESHFQDALRRLQTGEPIQYIIGSTDFCGLILKVQPGVLIPRPETEELAILITRENQHIRNQQVSILDLGTGSGCLALAMKKAFPLADVTGIEKFPDALLIATQNALVNQLEVTFRKDDFLKPLSFEKHEIYDIIVSNPPYIPEHERANMSSHVVDYEPEHALFVPDNHPLLFFEAIAAIAKERLKPNGLLYVEIHEFHGEETVDLFRKEGFKTVELIRDGFGNNRFVKASTPFQKFRDRTRIPQDR